MVGTEPAEDDPHLGWGQTARDPLCELTAGGVGNTQEEDVVGSQGPESLSLGTPGVGHLGHAGRMGSRFGRKQLVDIGTPPVLM